MNLKRKKYLEDRKNLMTKTLINYTHQITSPLSNSGDEI